MLTRRLFVSTSEVAYTRMEFFLNVFTEFAEFSDRKKIKNQKGGLQGWNPGPPV